MIEWLIREAGSLQVIKAGENYAIMPAHLEVHRLGGIVHLKVPAQN